MKRLLPLFLVAAISTSATFMVGTEAVNEFGYDARLVSGGITGQTYTCNVLESLPDVRCVVVTWSSDSEVIDWNYTWNTTDLCWDADANNAESYTSETITVENKGSVDEKIAITVTSDTEWTILSEGETVSDTSNISIQTANPRKNPLNPSWKFAFSVNFPHLVEGDNSATVAISLLPNS